MKLSFYVNIILNLENSIPLDQEEAQILDGFDDAVLIIDDIKDRSKIRNGKPCRYLEVGVDVATNEAILLRGKSFDCLNSICTKRRLGIIKKCRSRWILRELQRKIDYGQNLDLQLQNTCDVNNKTLITYDLMISSFTGGHIRYGFLLGFLLSGATSEYKKEVLEIGELIGLLRQIDDDVKDYQEQHHEFLGDLINHKKRLPELLFLLSANQIEKDYLNKLLENPKQNFILIKEFIFNDVVKTSIDTKKSKIKKDIENKTQKIPDKYQKILIGLTNKFL